ncbi:MAG: twin-arginine translocase TatA/TatE family subunit [Planctomycetaceae bacterium]|nr:twin-arginine translocase TatA/TatE family subunit [Planctomycetaceae bacterium]
MSPFSTFALFTGPPGMAEILIVLIVVLLLFGKRLPGVMRSLGTSIVEFKKGINEMDQEDGSQDKVTEKEEDKA